jgi:hypothetical protein
LKKWSYDLHIHTALSPCACNDMTPNNIVNMSLIKGLDVIAITDHNSCRNAQAVIKVGFDKGLRVLPGIEVQTQEEVHLLCLFGDIERAMDFQELLYKTWPYLPNDPRLFGEQLILDDRDNVIGKEDRLLLGSVNMSIEEICYHAIEKEGIVVPAHIDRQSYSIISNLGFIPESLNFRFVEISKDYNFHKLCEKYTFLNNYYPIINSDSHSLGSIMEPIHFLTIYHRDLLRMVFKNIR